MARFHQHDFEQQLHALLKTFYTAKDVEKLRRHWLHLCDDARVKNISMRFRWDLLYTTIPEKRQDLLHEIYNAGFDDSHIDRSLHRFCKTLNLPFYPQEYNGK